LQATLKHRLSLHAPELTPTVVLKKLAEIRMIDLWILAVDHNWLILPRNTQPSPNTRLLMEKLKWQLPSQPPPRLVAKKRATKSIKVQPAWQGGARGGDLSITSPDSKALKWISCARLGKFG